MHPETLRVVTKKLPVTLEELFYGFEKKLNVSRVIEEEDGVLTKSTVLLSVNGLPGWTSGAKIHFQGAGDKRFGSPAQDIDIIIELLPHDYFQREGDHLIINTKVPLYSALLGHTEHIEGIDGKKINIPIRCSHISHSPPGASVFHNFDTRFLPSSSVLQPHPSGHGNQNEGRRHAQIESPSAQARMAHRALFGTPSLFGTPFTQASGRTMYSVLPIPYRPSARLIPQCPTRMHHCWHSIYRARAKLFALTIGNSFSAPMQITVTPAWAQNIEKVNEIFDKTYSNYEKW